jgi:hypothetical protein
MNSLYSGIPFDLLSADRQFKLSGSVGHFLHKKLSYEKLPVSRDSVGYPCFIYTVKTHNMDKHLKDKATPRAGHNDTGVGEQFDPNQGKGSIEDTKPGNSTINNPPKEQTKDETEKARGLANEDDQAH